MSYTNHHPSPVSGGGGGGRSSSPTRASTSTTTSAATTTAYGATAAGASSHAHAPLERDLQNELDAIEVPLPAWGERAILRAVRTDAWGNLMCLLNDRVHESIGSAGLMAFSDMRPAEQSAVVEQQFREVMGWGGTSLCDIYMI